MLHVTLPALRINRYGAGVIFAIREGSIFIMTARHVVEQETPEKREKPEIGVIFKTDDTATYPAQGQLYLSKEKDVAFLVVKNNELAEKLESELDWHILPTSKSATESKYATIIGNGGGKQWTKPLAPERIISRRNDEIEIDSRSTRPGDSGGGVFDTNDQLIGIVIADTEGAVALALSTERILREARGFGLPVDLVANKLATPAVFIAPLAGEPSRWGSEIAAALGEKLKQTRRVIECGNEQALSVAATIDIRSGTPTSDVAVLSWRFAGGHRGPSAPVTQHIEIDHFPWTAVRKSPETLSSKTGEAVEFAINSFNRYLSR